MRRTLLTVAVVLAALLTGACAAPAGTDRNLVDDWAMLPAAKVPEPHTGDCWTSGESQLGAIRRTPSLVYQSACDASHPIETVSVGQFTGTLADASAPPTIGQAGEAYTSCTEEAGKFLGSHWANGRIQLMLVVPTSAQWRGGARFYRCDVVALRSEGGILEPRTTTLKGTLAAGGEMLLSCSNQLGSGDSFTDLTATPCTSPHDTEFMGVVTSTMSTAPAKDQLSAAFGAPCTDMLRTVTRLPNSRLGAAQASIAYWETGTTEEWQAGNHTARCYLMLPKKITRSLRDAGDVAI